MDIYKLARMVFDYGSKGAFIAAGAALMVFTVASTFDLMRQPPSDRLLAVLLNYFITGAVIGGLAGLLNGLWRWWRAERDTGR